MEITQAASYTSLENIATATEKVGTNFDNDYQALMESLGNEAATFSNEAATLNNAATTLNHEAAALNQRAAALNVTVSVRGANRTSSGTELQRQITDLSSSQPTGSAEMLAWR